MTNQACRGQNGIFLGWDSDCGRPACPPIAPAGACCVGSNCVMRTAAHCLAAGGFYQGDGTTCGDLTCVRGACCHSGGVCDDVTALG